MDTLDSELRRLLQETELGSVDPEGALAGVQGLRRRRTTRTAVAWVGCVAAAVALTVFLLPNRGPGDAAPPAVENPVDLAGAIPWSDREDIEDWEQPPPTDRPIAAPCRAQDLRLLSATQGGATGHTGTTLRYANDGAARCTLQGFPNLRSNEGALVPEHGTWFAHPAVAATVDPGEIAMTVIETSVACEPQTPTVILTDVMLVLSNGALLPTRRDFESSCPIRIDSWFRPDDYPSEPPSRFEGLQATIEAPETVRPGSVLTYVVTLTNTAESALELTPCPGFGQVLTTVEQSEASEKPTLVGSWRLNCDTVRSLAPGASARFVIQLDVPDSVASTREVLLQWQLRDTLPDDGAQTWLDVG